MNAIFARQLQGDSANYGSDGYDAGKIKGSDVEALLWPLSAAEASKVPESVRKSSNKWWLRSPGKSDDKAAYVAESGEIIQEGCFVQAESATMGVRPAFDLNLNAVILTSSAKKGKEVYDTVDADSLGQVGTNDSSYWKVTLGDSSHADFKILTEKAVFEKENQTLMVPYSGAAVGDNEFISALICNSSGNVTYYGRMMEASSAPNAYVTINLKNKYREGDKVYIFNEQVNGNYDTDYGSPLCPISPNDAKEPSATKLNVEIPEWYEGGFYASENAPLFTYDPDDGEGITSIDWVISNGTGSEVLQVQLPKYIIDQNEQPVVEVTPGSDEFKPYDFQELNEKTDIFNAMHAGIYDGFLLPR